MRTVLGVRAQTVDILCKVERLYSRREAGVKNGYLLAASYTIRAGSDAFALYDCLQQINPELVRNTPSEAPSGDSRGGRAVFSQPLVQLRRARRG